ncbi:hypothetical protein EJJ20_24975 [Pseudomonas poae]|nr:hypothetical protein EJJ20_24975 [Pseudomonas poae]
MTKLMNRLVLISALSGLYTGVASALDVQAEIKPDPSNPSIAQIVNLTPQSGYCTEAAFSAQCSSRGIRSNSFPITLTGPVAQNQVIPFGIPANWSTFTVQHDTIPGETAEIRIRIAGVGTRYRLNATAQSIIGAPGFSNFDAHAFLMTPSWSTGTGACQSIAGSSQAGALDGQRFAAFWLSPLNVTTCPRDSDYNIPNLTLETLDVHYMLEAVRPEKLISGGYHGSFSYTVGGAGSDFNMGSLTPSSSLMTFDLNLAVKQDVKVDMSADRVHLAPKGGWLEWINHGRQSEKLLGDLRFFILTSSPFKITLTCEHPGTNTCEINNGTHAVPVNMSVSLASPWVDGVGLPVERRALTLDGMQTQRFSPTGAISRAPSVVHFEVPSTRVDSMASGSSYRGTVYITFDSDI